MPRSLLRSLLLSLITILAIPVVAQQKRIANVTHISRNKLCINVYEYDCVDVQPQFPGGDSAMLKFINRERRYPSRAYRAGIEGRVLCSFVVNEDGSLSHISVLRGVEESLNREAVRIISNMPDWTVGSIDDVPVPVYCILPIPFRL